jgi:hypothetical protein
MCGYVTRPTRTYPSPTPPAPHPPHTRRTANFATMPGSRNSNPSTLPSPLSSAGGQVKTYVSPALFVPFDMAGEQNIIRRLPEPRLHPAVWYFSPPIPPLYQTRYGCLDTWIGLGAWTYHWPGYVLSDDFRRNASLLLLFCFSFVVCGHPDDFQMCKLSNDFRGSTFR